VVGQLPDRETGAGEPEAHIGFVVIVGEELVEAADRDQSVAPEGAVAALDPLHPLRITNGGAVLRDVEHLKAIIRGRPAVELDPGRVSLPDWPPDRADTIRSIGGERVEVAGEPMNVIG